MNSVLQEVSNTHQAGIHAMPAPKPLVPEKISPFHMQQFNRLFISRSGFDFTLGRTNYTFAFIPEARPNAAHIKFGIRIDGRLLFKLNVEIEFIADLLHDFQDMGDLLEMPPALKEIVLEFAAEGLFDQFDRCFNCKSTLVALPQANEDQEFDFQLPFKVRRANSDVCSYGTISAGREGTTFILDKLEQPSGDISRDLGDLPLSVSFETGLLILTRSEMAQIGQNDIILIGRDYFPHTSKMMIRVSPERVLEGNFTQSGQIILKKKEFMQMTETPQTAEKEEEKKADEENIDALIEDIPVKLLFQIGETHITFGELSRIQAGYTFELGTDLKKPVLIKANGKKFGRGEMVQVGDRIGVRVLQFENFSKDTSADTSEN